MRRETINKLIGPGRLIVIRSVVVVVLPRLRSMSFSSRCVALHYCRSGTAYIPDARRWPQRGVRAQCPVATARRQFELYKNNTDNIKSLKMSNNNLHQCIVGWQHELSPGFALT